MNKIIETAKEIGHYILERSIQSSIYLLAITIICCINVGFWVYTIDLATTMQNSFEYVQSYFWINSANPTPSGFFLSSYSHEILDNGEHLRGNMLGFAIASLLIGILSIWRNIGNNPLPKKYLIFVYGSILLILPFVISEFCLIVAAISRTPCPGAKGFSGIVCAFSGVVVYLVIQSIIRSLSQNESVKKSDNKIGINKKTIISIILLVALMGLIIFLLPLFADMSISQSLYSNIGHCTGFVFGVLVAYLFDKYLPKQKKI